MLTYEQYWWGGFKTPIIHVYTAYECSKCKQLLRLQYIPTIYKEDKETLADAKKDFELRVEGEEFINKHRRCGVWHRYTCAGVGEPVIDHLNVIEGNCESINER